MKISTSLEIRKMVCEVDFHIEQISFLQFEWKIHEQFKKFMFMKFLNNSTFTNISLNIHLTWYSLEIVVKILLNQLTTQRGTASTISWSNLLLLRWIFDEDMK